MNLNVAHQRLHNQGIADARFRSAGEAVAWLGAVQAQDFVGALWAVGLRVQGATEGDIERAIAARTLVRTWPMRGTLHFVAAADVRWMLQLLTPRVIKGAAARYRQLELDEATFDRSRALFGKALEGGRQLARPAMYEVLERGGISPAGQRGIHILGRLAQEGLLCFGERAGKQPTFALLDEWVPASSPLSRDEALAELARRYFSGHGPATVQDFMWWSGLTAAEARVGLEMAKSHLTPQTVAGQTLWGSPTAPDTAVDADAAFLLPGFDELLLGYRDRRAVLDPAFNQRINPGSNGMFSPTLVLQGRIVGTWKRAFRKGAVELTLSPFAPLGDTDHDAIADAAQRYGAFLNMGARVEQRISG